MNLYIRRIISMIAENDNLQVLFSTMLQNREIQTVFQPIISLTDGSLYGYEALSRGPVNTTLQNPEYLFSYAMEQDRLWDLEYLCRTKALESASSLQAKGKLFLNVNPNIMNDEKFKQGFTKEYLSKYAIDAEKIVFEITEKEAINNLPDFKRTVDHYKKQSYQVAIDDVGSGYSGLNIITDIHPHFMKLDMKLIRDIDTDHTKHSLVKSLCEFADLSKISIIAEGIETREELLTVINLGVHFGQGYFIQKPEPSLSPIRRELSELIVNESKRKIRNSPTKIMNTSIEQLSSPLQTVDSAMQIANVAAFISKDNTLPGFCVTEGNELVGVITRNELNLKLSGPYGYSLFYKKPVSEIMSYEFLAVDASTPINIVAKLAMMRDHQYLYDFITVTKDNAYFGIVTVKDLLEKTMQIEVDYAMHLNPLTGLPGNLIIEQQLQKFLDLPDEYSVLYFDIDNFKPYNDVYGFEKGDKVLMELAKILKKTASTTDFVGHIGGDDFIMVVSSVNSVMYCEQVIKQFDASIQHFYHERDIAKGYIISKNRHGENERFPLLSISIAGINNDHFQSTFELAEKASDLKKRCKQLYGSNYLFTDNAPTTDKMVIK